MFDDFDDGIVHAQNVEAIVKEVGATFCKYLAFKHQIGRKYFHDCGEPSCSWDDWNDALVSKLKPDKERVVLSYGHNGFGNQLWEHSVAFMIAESLKARLMVAIIPDELSPGGVIPPNSWTGMGAMERMLPKEFQYELLPDDSPIRELCDAESFFIADRPYDWRNQNYSNNFKHNLVSLIEDSKPRCLKMVGYFQNLPLCAEDMKKLWTPRLFQNATQLPGDNDISIYLRCLPRHYHFNGRHFYEAILNHTSFDRIWLFQGDSSHVVSMPCHSICHPLSVTLLSPQLLSVLSRTSLIPTPLVMGWWRRWSVCWWKGTAQSSGLLYPEPTTPPCCCTTCPGWHYRRDSFCPCRRGPSGVACYPTPPRST